MASFLVKDKFEIGGVGLIIVGYVSKGMIKPGMSGEINGKKITIERIESQRKVKEIASERENVGFLIKGVNKNDIPIDVEIVFM